MTDTYGPTDAESLLGSVTFLGDVDLTAPVVELELWSAARDAGEVCGYQADHG